MLGRVARALKGRTPAEIVRLGAKTLAYAVTSQLPSARKVRAAAEAFDRRWGTETSGTRSLSSLQLSVDRERALHSVRYEPTSEILVEALIDGLGVDPSAWRFIDYGCGKGRVLLVAAMRPFAEVIGVEFAPELCAIAERNRDIVAGRGALKAPIRVVNADAGSWTPPPHPLVAYFYNPFDAALMAEVVAQLEASWKAEPRPMHVLYVDPRHTGPWDASSVFQLAERADGFTIYAAPGTAG
jgi:SAM-dependent methyltransferase